MYGITGVYQTQSRHHEGWVAAHTGPNAGFHPKPDSGSLGIFTVRKRLFTMLGIEAFWVKFLDENFDF